MFMEINNNFKNGESYEPNSLRGLFASVDKIIENTIVPVLSYKTTLFTKCRQVMKCKQNVF